MTQHVRTKKYSLAAPLERGGGLEVTSSSLRPNKKVILQCQVRTPLPIPTNGRQESVLLLGKGKKSFGWYELQELETARARSTLRPIFLSHREPLPSSGMVTWGGTTVFGGAAGTAAPAPGGFGFGAPAPAAPTAPAGVGGFGFGGAAPVPGPAGGGLFGAPPAPAPVGAGGLFGAPAPAPVAGGMFGAPPAPAAPIGAYGAAAPHQHHHTPHQAAYAAHALATRREEAVRLDSALVGLHSAYSPTSVDPHHLQPRSPLHASQPSSLCRFRHIFYDPMGPEERHLRMLHGPHHQPARPMHVDSRVWADAVAGNPDPEQYVPVCVVGSEALATRLASQQEKARVLAGHVSKLTEALSSLKVSLGKSSDSVRAGLAEHGHLRGRTQELVRKVEIVRCMNLPLQHAEREAMERVRTLVRVANATGRALSETEERGRAHAHRLRSLAARSPAQPPQYAETGLDLSERNWEDLHRVLREQGEGLANLGTIAKRDLRDAAILREEVGKAGSTNRGRAEYSRTHPALMGAGMFSP